MKTKETQYVLSLVGRQRVHPWNSVAPACAGDARDGAYERVSDPGGDEYVDSSPESEPLLSPFRYLFTGYAPIVGIDLIDNDKGGGRVFAQYIRQQLGYTGNKLLFLLIADLFLCDPDIDIRHEAFSYDPRMDFRMIAKLRAKLKRLFPGNYCFTVAGNLNPTGYYI